MMWQEVVDSFRWVSIYKLYPSEVYLSRTNNSAHSADHILSFKSSFISDPNRHKIFM